MEIEPIYLFDKNKELIDIIPYEDLLANSQDWTLNGLIKGTVTGIYTESIEQAHFYGTRDIDDPNVFWQYKIVNYTKENGQFAFEGIYVLFDDLAGRGVIRDRRPQNAPITTVMEYILEDTGWQLGQVQSTHKGTSNYYYVSKLEAFWDFISKWRVEFKPRMTFSGGKVTGKYIDIYDRLSDDFGKWYEYGDNLLTVVAEEMRESVFTAFIGRGKGEEVGDGFGRKIGFNDVIWTVEGGNPVDKPKGQDYVEIPWATDLYGYEDGAPRMTVVDFPDIEDAAELLNAAYEYALTECRPKAQFKSNVLENGRAEVGEIVTILRPDMGIRYKTRVFNLRRDFLNGAIKTTQFGEQLIQSTAQRTKKTATDIKKQEEQTVYWLEMLRQAVTDSYFNEDGYNYDLFADNEYGLPGGYYSFDRPIDQNPTKVVYVGAGKVLIANSQNPDGSWIWRTAITGDGIVADEINTGRLRADLIQAGFNNIGDGYGVLITQDGMYTVDPAGEYSLIASGGMQFYTKNDVLNGSIESVYYNETGDTGVGLFIQPDRVFSIVRNNPDGVANRDILRVPKDRDVIEIPATLVVNQVNIAGTNQYISNMSDDGGVYYDSLRISLGIGTPAGVSRKITVTQDSVDLLAPVNSNYPISAPRYNLKGTNQYLISSGNLGGSFIDTQKVSLGIGSPTSWTNYLSVLANQIDIFRELDLNGNTIVNQSDIRLKKNITDASFDAIREIERIRVIEHEWDMTNPRNKDKPEGRHFGIEAQSSPFLQLKAGDDESYLSVDLVKQINLLTLAEQQHIKRTKEIEEELEETKTELSELKALLKEKGLI